MLGVVASLLGLRQKAEAESRNGIRNSALLDAKLPGWRDELPIYVPVEDEALVAELLTGLLDERMTGLTVEGVEVRRYLVERECEWHPALQLLADGEIPLAKLPGLPATKSRPRDCEGDSATTLPARSHSSNPRSACSGVGGCVPICARPSS